MENKRGDIKDILFWLIIGIIILFILGAGFMLFRGKGSGAIEFIKNLFRLRN